MGNTTLADPPPPQTDDEFTDMLKDVSEILPEHQSRLEMSELEISGIRMYFEPEENADLKERPLPFLTMPSNEQMVKLIPVSNNRDILQITLLLDDVEKCDIPLKEIYEEVHRHLPQNENKYENSEIIDDQPMHITNGENLNFYKECSKNKSEEFVERNHICQILDYSLGNEKIFYVDASTSTDKYLTLRCETTIKKDLKVAKNGDSPTDLKETKHCDSQTDMSETELGGSQTDLTKTNYGDSQTDLQETIKHVDSQTNLKATKNGDSQINLRKTKDGNSQTDLRETKHIDTKIHLRETKNGDSETGNYSSDTAIPLLSHTHNESIVPLDCSAECDILQTERIVNADNFSLKTFPNLSSQSSVSAKTNYAVECATNNQKTILTTTLANSKETITSGSPSTDFLQSSQRQVSTESIYFKDFSTSFMQCDKLNKDGFVASGDSSSKTVPVTYVEESEKMSSRNGLCEINPQEIASTTQTALKEGSMQTDEIFHSEQTGNTSNSKESLCVQKEATAQSKVYKEDSNKTHSENSKLNIKEQKKSSTNSKIPTAIEADGILKRSRHPIFPCRLFKHTSSKKRINRPSHKRTIPSPFSLENSDVITSEAVSVGIKSTENKREHALKQTLLKDGKKPFRNPNLDEDKPFLATEDVKKPSSNQTSIKEDNNYYLKAKHTKHVKIRLLHDDTTDDKDPINPTLIRIVRKHSLESSPTRSKKTNATSPNPIEDEHKYSIYPSPNRVDKKYLVSASIKNDKKRYLVTIKDIKMDSPIFKNGPVEELIYADCLKGNSSTERAIPISASLALEQKAKSFQFQGKEPVETTINPVSIEFVDYPTKDFHNQGLRRVDCANINDNIELEISEKQNSESKSTTETKVPFPTVVFNRNSFLGSTTTNRNNFVVGLCHECYSKTERTVDEFLTKGGPSMPTVELKPFCNETSSSSVTCADEASSNSDAELCIELCSNSDAELCADEASSDSDATELCVELSSNSDAEICVEESSLCSYSEMEPCMESSSDAEIQQGSESSRVTCLSKYSSMKSLIEKLYTPCEVVNDHLLDLMQVDEDLLKESISTLIDKWLTVATGKYSKTKEVYNYLQYLQEFSDNLTKFIMHSTDPQGNNALHFAFGNNRFDMAEELLNNKHGTALLTKRNKLGHTPLMICAISQPQTREDWMTVRKSVKLGNVNEVSQSGQTALMNAASRGCTEMLSVLLGAGAVPNQRDRDGSTALMYATEQGKKACVDMLMQHPDCDPTLQDHDGQTASSIAISAGHKEIALLIYLKTKKLPCQGMQPATKTHKKKNLSKKSQD